MAFTKRARGFVLIIVILSSFGQTQVGARTSGDQQREADLIAAKQRWNRLVGNIDVSNSALQQVSNSLPTLPSFPGASATFRFDGTIDAGFESAGTLFLTATMENEMVGHDHALLLSTKGAEPQEVNLAHQFNTIEFWSFNGAIAILRAVDMQSNVIYYRLQSASLSVTTRVEFSDNKDAAAPPSGLRCSGFNVPLSSVIRASRGSSLSMRDSTGRAIADVPSEILARASGGATLSPTVFAGCHVSGRHVLLWLGSGTNKYDGVTYEAKAGSLVPIASGVPLVVTPSYILFVDQKQAYRGAFPLRYKLLRS